MSLKWRILVGVIIVIILWKMYTHYGTYQSKGLDVIPKTEPTGDEKKIKLTVYYEALCSDSRNFILSQLLPTYNLLGKYLYLELVPYGKAKTIEEGDKITFQCQHGALECVANKIHACVLDKITSSYFRLKYVACMIADNLVPEEAGERCAKDLNFSYQPISECAASERGNLLLKAYGIATHAVQPTISFIPTVEVDGSQKIPLAHLLKDLKKELCQLLPINTEECIEL
ncbi:GILT-like protein C02D5.2 [Agrilus planipennis]|uniref:GILT-like protein C02D5.2 n=1 Tax=Agrilus planipennis TaxID=224129 RepID=A0A1W4WKR4_AGRPL|nr:GILT-like protein C02D5.2 [Agrilus planipennis]